MLVAGVAARRAMASLYRYSPHLLTPLMSRDRAESTSLVFGNARALSRLSLFLSLRLSVDPGRSGVGRRRARSGTPAAFGEGIIMRKNHGKNVPDTGDADGTRTQAHRTSGDARRAPKRKACQRVQRERDMGQGRRARAARVQQSCMGRERGRENGTRSQPEKRTMYSRAGRPLGGGQGPRRL